MAADDVTKTVKAVEELDHKSGDQGGGKAAYAELKKEYDSFSKNHTAEETKQYWDGVTKQLKDSKVLPDLAVAWGQENFSEIDGKSAGDLKLPYKYDFPSAPAQYDFDKTFANQLSESFKTVDTTGSFWTNSDDGKISQHDLDIYLNKQSETNKDIAEKATNRGDMAPLFKGNPPLISVLDGADDNNQQDGNVSKDDMNRFLSDYNRFTNNGATKAPEGSPYTAENAKYVKDILDGKHPGVSDGGGFDVGDLAKKGGFDNKDINNAGDYSSVVEKFNSLQPKEDPAANAGVTTNGDSTVVKYPDGRERDFHFTGDQLDSVKDFTGNWKRNSDGTWVDASDANKKAPFKDVSVDRATGSVTYDNGDQGKLTVDKNGDVSNQNGDTTGNTITANGDTYTVHQKDANKDVTVKVRSEGNGPEATQTPYDVTMPDGAHYTKDDQGKWSGPDGKKDFNFDSKTGALSWTGEDNKVHSMDSSGKITDGSASATTTLDANNASITKNDAGAVTEVKYPDGSTRQFEYTNGVLSSFTNPDGHKYVSDDGGKTFKNPEMADIHDAKVDADGTFHCVADGQGYKFDTTNKPSKEDVSTASGDPVEKQLVDAGTAKAGDGYIKIAARLLGKPSANDTDPAVRALYQELEKLNNNKPLHPGDTVVTPEILGKIQNEDFKKYVAGLKQPAPQDQSQTDDDDTEEA